MKHKTYMWLSAVVFLLVGIAHLFRAVAGWDVVIAGAFIPVWLSWVGLIVAFLLSYFGFKHSGEMK